MGRLFVSILGVSAGMTGTGLLVGTLALTEAPPEPPARLYTTPPPWGLPAGWSTEILAADPGVCGPLSAFADTSEIRVLVKQASGHFDVPRAFLDGVVRNALRRRAHSPGWTLAPLEPVVIDEIRSVTRERDSAIAAKLSGFLGRDQRPFDSHLSEMPAVGIALRAAHLVERRITIQTELWRRGFHPTDETAWFLAMLAHTPGDREVSACVEEAAGIGPARAGEALIEVRPTVALFSDPSFVLRALLRKWDEAEAKARRTALLRSSQNLQAALERDCAAG